MVATLTFPPNKKVGYEEENGANVCKWEGNRSETAATTEDIQRVSPLYAQLNPWVAFRVCLFFFFQLPDNKNGGRMDYLALVALGEMSSSVHTPLTESLPWVETRIILAAVYLFWNLPAFVTGAVGGGSISEAKL
jgi:hypothetical protein